MRFYLFLALSLIGLCPCSSQAAVIYASHGNGILSSINPATGVATVIGNSSIQMFDIAISTGGSLFGTEGISASNSRFYSINPNTAAATFIGNTGAFINALTFNYEGTLYGAGLNRVYTLNPATGLATALPMTLGSEQSAGDMVFGPNGQLYLTTNSNKLLTINPLTGGILSSVNISGFSNIWGLVYANGQLIGMSGQNVFSINPTTGATSLIGTTGIDSAIYGATSTPVPEPATLAILSLVATTGFVYRRRRLAITA